MIKSVHVESGHLTSTDSSLGMRTLPSRRFSLLDTKESLTGSSTHTPLLSSLPDHVSSSLGHGQVVYCVRRETFVVQSKSDVPKVPVGCSEGPSWMFRRSQSDVWKVPVGCLEVPDVRKFQSDVRRLFGDGIVTSYIIVMVLCLAYTQLSHKACTVSTTICIAMQCDVECVLREIRPLLWLARAT